MQQLPDVAKLTLIHQFSNIGDLVSTCSVNRDWADFCLRETTRRQIQFSLKDFTNYGLSLFRRSLPPELSSVQFLVEYGVDPYLLFQEAIKYHQKEYYDYFLEIIPDVNLLILPDRSTLLGTAVKANQTSLVRELLELGADPDLSSVIWSASDSKDALLLIRYGAKYSPNELLFWALRKGMVDLVIYLLKKGANINSTDQWGCSVLMAYLEIENPQLDFVKYLLEQGADPNLGTKNPSYFEDVRKMLGDYRVSKTWGPLDTAIYRHLIPIAQVILQYGGRSRYYTSLPSVPTSSMLTLSEAIQRNDVKSIEELVKLVDVNKRDAKEVPPLIYAIRGGDPHVVQLLLEEGADPNPLGFITLANAIEQGDPDIVRLLLTYGADVNHQDSEGRTPLHYAILKGREDLVRRLVQAGADRELADNHGMTPVDYALQQNNRAIVQALLT